MNPATCLILDDRSGKFGVPFRTQAACANLGMPVTVAGHVAGCLKTPCVI